MSCMFRNSIVVIAVVGSSLLTRGLPAQTVETIPTARLLPPEVTIYATMPSVDEFKERWQQSLYGQLQADPNLADFWSDVEEQLQVGSKELEQKLGLTLNELSQIPSGEVSFAVVQPPGKKLAVVGFLDFGENADAVEKLLQKADEALEADAQTKRSVQEFEDDRITVYTFGKPQDGGNSNALPVESKLAYVVKDSVIVVASSVDLLQAVLVRWDGEHPKTFAENETFQYVQQRCRNSDTAPLLSWYVDPISLFKEAVAANPSNMQAKIVLGFLPTLGLASVKGVGGMFDLATEKFDSVSKTLVYVEPPSTGVLNILQFPVTDQSPQKWISDEFTAFFSVNWDLPNAYNAVEELVDGFQGAGSFATLVDRLASQDGGPKIHIKKDLIDSLSGRIQFLRVASDPDQDVKERFVLAFELQNPVGIKGTLDNITKTPGFPGKIREFQGVTLYEFPAGAGVGTVGLGVARNHLMISSDVTVLETIIRDDSDRAALLDSDDYQKIARHFPTQTSIRFFQKQDTQIKALYDLMRSGNTRGFPGGGAANALPGIDFSKLPPFETIQKYLKPTGTYGVPDPNGAMFVSFSLRE